MKRDGFPKPPEGLAYGEVRLRFVKLFPGDQPRGLAPFYHFRIVVLNGAEVGHLNLRIGESGHVMLYAGHLGYDVHEKHRGHGYALQACKAVGPFVKTLYPSIIITCDNDNYPSIRTIERLGATFLNEVPVDPHDPTYQRPNLRKKRYRWTP